MAHIESKTTITLTETTLCATGTGDTLRVVPLPRSHVLKDGWRIATDDDIAVKAAEEAARKAAEEAARKAAETPASTPEASPSSQPTPGLEAPVVTSSDS